MPPLTRREVFERTWAAIAGGLVATGLPAGTAAAARAQTADSDLEIVSVRLPETIVPDEPFEVGMTVENTGDEALEPEPSYAFDQQRVLSGGPSENLPIEPGSREEFSYGGVTLRIIDQSLPGDGIEAGEHQHSIGFTDGPRESSPVNVTEGGGTSDDGASGLSTDGTAPEDSKRERGFFTNSGDGPEFLSNAFNLTVLGFLLSVVGIVHQMIQGR